MTGAAPLTGIWSGDRVTLTLTATGGSLTEDCASATIDAPVVSDATGNFTASGHREADSGGPQAGDAVPRTVPVRYAGRFDGERLELRVAAKDMDPAIYRLQPGVRGKRLRCM